MPVLAGVSFARRCSLSRDRFPVALLFSGLFLAACLMPAQSDTWWQLRAGEWTWEAGRPMLRDEFTHTVEGQPWPNHEWLSNLLFFLVYKAGGLPLLTALCAAAVTLAWGLVFRLTRGPVILRVALTGAGALLSSPAWCLRPQVLTLAMVAITLTLLVERRRLWLLPVLFVLWANLHGAVALGGVMVFAAWLAHAALDRPALPRFTVIAFLCLMATAATPLGLRSGSKCRTRSGGCRTTASSSGSRRRSRIHSICRSLPSPRFWPASRFDAETASRRFDD